MPTLTPPPGQNIVALAVDNRMIYGFLVLVSAILRTASAPVFLVVGYFPSELNESRRDLIRRFLDAWGAKYELLESKPHELFTERRHLTITTFSKFVIADQIAQPHLWLDIDTIVRPGWDDIFATMRKVGTKTALVVAEKIVSPHTRFEGFNAGVLGWTAAPRKAWVDALASLPEKRFSSEQYLFNTLYSDSFVTVEPDYNFLSSWHAELPAHPNPRVIHFSGPIKPWHLARRHVSAWQSINPTWDFWFSAEDAMVREPLSGELLATLLRLRRSALFSGRLHTGKGALAGWVMRFLAVAGPLGDVVVGVLRRRARA
jgi:lipopolysaccharide biosynthesis glycosyltransferase